MRRLVRGGKWIPNNTQSGGCLWVGKDGVFIDWQAGSQDIANILARDAFAGIPRDPDTLCDLLVNAGMLKMTKDNARYWSITLPVTLESRDGMVRLAKNDSIFPTGYDLDQFRSVTLTLDMPPHRTPASTTPANAQAPKPHVAAAVASEPPDDGQATSKNKPRKANPPIVAPTHQPEKAAPVAAVPPVLAPATAPCA
ncbi:MAG: TraI domain-containing protein [Rhodocyclaceae bacterium]|nr:TraI domain-containing protein [Rhodocyclaceae bacterium]